MSPIHDVSCFQAAREDVVGVKVGTAPRRRSIAIANTSFDFTRVEYAIANCRAAAKGRDVLGSDMAAWSGRDADSRMNGGCRKLICDEDTSAKTILNRNHGQLPATRLPPGRQDDPAISQQALRQSVRFG